MEMSKELKNEFKAACAINGDEMTSVIIRFVNSYCRGKSEELNRIINKYKNKGVNE